MERSISNVLTSLRDAWYESTPPFKLFAEVLRCLFAML